MDQLKAYIEKRIEELKKLKDQYEKTKPSSGNPVYTEQEIYAIRTTLMYLEDIVKQFPHK